MASDQIFVGLEIGTTKICVIVSEGRSDGTISILGVG
jgi:cell division protein FtsA